MDSRTETRRLPAGAPVLVAEPAFDVSKAYDLGVLGTHEARATTSGVEALACCHSMVATG